MHGKRQKTRIEAHRTVTQFTGHGSIISQVTTQRKLRGQGASTDGDADGFERARGVATKVDDECEAGGGGSR